VNTSRTNGRDVQGEDSSVVYFHILMASLSQPELRRSSERADVRDIWSKLDALEPARRSGAIEKQNWAGPDVITKVAGAVFSSAVSFVSFDRMTKNRAGVRGGKEIPVCQELMMGLTKKLHGEASAPAWAQFFSKKQCLAQLTLEIEVGEATDEMKKTDEKIARLAERLMAEVKMSRWHEVVKTMPRTDLWSFHAVIEMFLKKPLSVPKFKRRALREMAHAMKIATGRPRWEFLSDLLYVLGKDISPSTLKAEFSKSAT
jgi:hypothetical protein